MEIWREKSVDVEINVSKILMNLSSEEKREALKILNPSGMNIPTRVDDLMEYLKNAPGSEIEYLKMKLDDETKAILRKLI